MLVLIVDDCPELVEFESKMVKLYTNAEVVTAGDGISAMSQLDKYEFDLILCDIEMPHMDGVVFYTMATQLYPKLVGRFVFRSSALEELDMAGIEERRLMKPYRIREFKEACGISS